MADVSSKSAQYCAPGMTGGTGLLLLCEVRSHCHCLAYAVLALTSPKAELGKPMYEIPTGNSNAQQEAEKLGAKSTLGVGKTAPQGWNDAGSVHETLKGVQMVYDPSRALLKLAILTFDILA